MELGLSEDENHTDFKHFDNARLQNIVDYIVNKVQLEIGQTNRGGDLTIEYVGGQKVNIPAWYLSTQGHELEDKLTNIFEELKRYQREGELKKEIINKVIDEIPDFIPVELLVTLKEIQD